MSVLVIAEHDNASIKGATLNTVTAAAACGGDVHILVAGHNAGAAAQAAAQIAGVAKVIHADAAGLEHGLAENVAAQVLAIASNYSHILFPATAGGKNVPPQNIELRFKDVAFIDHALVYGDGKKFLVLGVWLNHEALDARIKERGVSGERGATARAWVEEARGGAPQYARPSRRRPPTPVGFRVAEGGSIPEEVLSWLLSCFHSGPRRGCNYCQVL